MLPACSSIACCQMDFSHRTRARVSTATIMRSSFLWSCLFDCLFKSCVVLYYMLAWWIESVFAEFHTSLDPTPRPGGCIIRTWIQWRILIFIVVFDPKPMEAKHFGLRTVIVLCGLHGGISHHLAGCHHTSP